MTDNEIIKALECCLGENAMCELCPYDKHPYRSCMDNLLGDVLDLINRQKAEIERLSVKEKTLKAIINHYKRQLKSAKSEAYREFADKLVDAFNKDINLYGRCTVHDVALKINNTLNELTRNLHETCTGSNE